MEPQKKDSILTIPAAIIIAGLIIGAAIIYIKKPANEGTLALGEKKVAAAAISLDPVTTNDHVRGSIDAPIKIVEFSDLECPFCRVFHERMKQVMNEYGTSGKVAWIYRHFPLAMHPKAHTEAVATECAFEQGGDAKFWQYTDAIFAVTPSNNQFDLAKLPEIAKTIGLDVTKFNTCLTSGKYDAKIKAQYDDGVRVGIGTLPETGTPYSIIIDKKGNKIPINGAQPYEVIKQLIEAVLADNK